MSSWFRGKCRLASVDSHTMPAQKQILQADDFGDIRPSASRLFTADSAICSRRSVGRSTGGRKIMGITERAHGLVLSRGLFGFAAALWLSAVFLPSTASGSGATLSGHRFADLMISGVLSVSAPSWLGLIWYAIPICGALTLMALGLRGRWGSLLRVGAASLATASALGFGAAVSSLEMSRFGFGLWFDVVGSASALTALSLEPRIASTEGVYGCFVATVDNSSSQAPDSARGAGPRWARRLPRQIRRNVVQGCARVLWCRLPWER